MQPTGPWLGRGFAGFVRQCVLPAVLVDPEVARAALRRANLLDPPDEFARRADIIGRVADLQATVPRPSPGAFPSKQEILELFRAERWAGGGSPLCRR